MRSTVLVRLGVRTLLVHKLRSTLSILGVVFGVAAVVAMSSVGEGGRREALAQVGALGIDTLTAHGRGQAGAGLLLRDSEAVREVVPHLMAVAPVREAVLPAEADGRRAEAVVVGTTPDYRTAARLVLAAGRFLADLDLSDRKRVAVLGASVAGALFPLDAPLGNRLRLGGDWYEVVGVLEGRAATRARGSALRTRDVNRAIIVPLPVLDRGADPRPEGIDEIVARVDEVQHVVATAEAVKSLLERRAGGAVDVIVPREILRQRERTQRIFNAVTGAIAAISLLVGGIGIMNIMLASVAERTREVGIRRAVGASRDDIAAQFLFESSLLTCAGGVLGVLLGIAGAFAIERLAGWPTALSPRMLVLALLSALAVGVGFGFYPARRAARLEPMEALRYE